jgi:hypothetical protein
MARIDTHILTIADFGDIDKMNPRQLMEATSILPEEFVAGFRGKLKDAYDNGTKWALVVALSNFRSETIAEQAINAFTEAINGQMELHHADVDVLRRAALREKLTDKMIVKVIAIVKSIAEKAEERRKLLEAAKATADIPNTDNAIDEPVAEAAPVTPASETPKKRATRRTKGATDGVNGVEAEALVTT